MTVTTPPVVHDFQFGSYSSPHTARGRHSSWPCWCGLTRSHGRRAGGWVRFGDRSYWCCLQRPRRLPRSRGDVVRGALYGLALSVLVVLIVLAAVSVVGVFA